jgi:hypothetical protein
MLSGPGPPVLAPVERDARRISAMPIHPFLDQPVSPLRRRPEWCRLLRKMPWSGSRVIRDRLRSQDWHEGFAMSRHAPHRHQQLSHCGDHPRPCRVCPQSAAVRSTVAAMHYAVSVAEPPSRATFARAFPRPIAPTIGPPGKTSLQARPLITDNSRPAGAAPRPSPAQSLGSRPATLSADPSSS